MVNLLLTTRCNRSCRYCFAREKVARDAAHAQDISLENVDRVLDFLETSGCSTLQLAGGEPTVHPRFEEILIRVLSRGFTVNLLSNGLWRPGLRSLFSRVSPANLGILLNIDHPGTYSRDQWETLMGNLEGLCRRGNVSVSFNIFEKKPKAEYIFRLVSRFGFHTIRLSFSMPVVFGDRTNEYLPISEYRDLAPFFLGFLRRADRLGVTVRVDNTIPPCMFSPAQVGRLILRGVIDPRRNFVCNPAIDVGPDLSVWRCFGTSGLFNRSLEDFRTLAELEDYYQAALRPLQYGVYPMPECASCEYARREVCQGGCIGYAAAVCMAKGSWPAEAVDPLSMRLVLSDDTIRTEYDLPSPSVILLKGDRELVEITPALDRYLSYFDGERTVRETVIAQVRNAHQDGDDEILDDLLVTVVSEKVIPLVRELLARGFLVSSSPASAR